MVIKLKTNEFFFEVTMKIKKIAIPIQTLVAKNIENKTRYSVQELRLCLFSFLAEVISTSLVFSIFSVHFSTNLFTNLLLHLQFL